MTRSRRILATLATAWLAALAIPAVAPAQNPAMSEKQEYWTERYDELKRQVEQLSTSLEDAPNRWSRERSRNRLRGQEREDLRKEIERLEQELATARERLDRFPEEARQAGALPGWFR